MRQQQIDYLLFHYDSILVASCSLHQGIHFPHMKELLILDLLPGQQKYGEKHGYALWHCNFHLVEVHVNSELALSADL